MLADAVTLSGVLSFKVYDGVVSPETLKYTSPEFHNLVTTAGKNFFLQRANGTAVTALSGFLIGNGTTAAAVGDVALSGASKYRQSFDSVSTVGAVTTYTTTVAAGNATFVNNEFGVTNATTSALTDGVLVTHLIAGPYTKAAPDVIVYVYALTQA